MTTNINQFEMNLANCSEFTFPDVEAIVNTHMFENIFTFTISLSIINTIFQMRAPIILYWILLIFTLIGHDK